MAGIIATVNLWNHQIRHLLFAEEMDRPSGRGGHGHQRRMRNRGRSRIQRHRQSDRRPQGADAGLFHLPPTEIRRRMFRRCLPTGRHRRTMAGKQQFF